MTEKQQRIVNAARGDEWKTVNQIAKIARVTAGYAGVFVASNARLFERQVWQYHRHLYRLRTAAPQPTTDLATTDGKG